MSKETEPKFELPDAFVRQLFLKTMGQEAMAYLAENEGFECFYESFCLRDHPRRRKDKMCLTDLFWEIGFVLGHVHEVIHGTHNLPKYGCCNMNDFSASGSGTVRDIF